MTARAPYWRLSGFYLFYFAALGTFLPYWALYLESKGHTPTQIGQFMAIVAGSKIVAPNLWGWLADHTGQNLRLIRIACFLTVCAFAGVFAPLGFIWLLVVGFAFSFFWNAALPPFEAVTLRHLHRDAHRYSRIRLWGSVGFSGAVLAVGAALRSVLAIDCLPQLVLLLFIGLWLASLLVPRTAPVMEASHGGFRRALMRPHVLAFIGVTLLLQAAHAPYYVFFSVYLEDAGFDSGQIGKLWALGVLAEIVLFLGIHRIYRNFSLRGIFLVSIALSILRWLLIAWGLASLGLLVAAQLLHAASFGATHAVAIQLTHNYFPGDHQSRGQSLYSSASFGVGGALGSLYSGYAWESLGGEGVYTVAAGLCLLALLIAWPWLDRTR